MIGILVALVVSWFLLRVAVREPITVLGISPTRQRLKEFVVGMLFMAGIAVINFVWQAHFKEISYEVNPAYGIAQLLGGTFWVVKAVVFEELVFRGAFLYLLIRTIGIVKACLISSIIFGIYHWFSYGVFGSSRRPDDLRFPDHGLRWLDVCLRLCEDKIAVRPSGVAPRVESCHRNRLFSRADWESVVAATGGRGSVERLGNAAVFLTASHRRSWAGYALSGEGLQARDVSGRW